MRAYSQEVRQQVLRAVDEGKSRAQIIDRFQVSRATIKRYVKQRRETGTVLPRPIPGRPPKKGAALQAGVQELLEAYPNARLEDYCQWWESLHGVKVSKSHMSRAIHAVGWMRTKARGSHQNVPERKSPCPRPSCSNKHWRRGGGGRADHARQYRRSKTQGSNQALTARSAFGQEM